MKKGEREKCLEAINENHALLVYPLQNRPEPKSLWSSLFPRTPLKWEWDSDADNRVARLWILREDLSRSGKVVYTKWFRGRATFFSKIAFVHLLRAVRAHAAEDDLRGEAQTLYEALLESSPRSTKELKAATDLRGRFFETTYQKAMKTLFEKGLVVAWGEVDEGAFPSLAVGATKVLFEDLWLQADPSEAEKSQDWLMKHFGPSFQKFLKQKT